MSSTDASKQAQDLGSAQKHEQPQRIGSGSSVSSHSTPSASLNICEMNADKEHAALDSWAEHNHKSMKQKEQLFEYREEQEAGLNGGGGTANKAGSAGGVFVGGRKIDDAALHPTSAAASKKEGAESAGSK